MGREVPQRLVAEGESFSPSLNITFILNGTTGNREDREMNNQYDALTLGTQSLGGIDCIVSVARNADTGASDAKPSAAESRME